ncbi:MAG: hypothetical protein K2L07_04890 [Lachnospiraceae bacterium]|nr:hypothetical protein [Lachnospiraceae bacterium]
MKNIQIYLAGGMQKFGKDDFGKSNNWRVFCKDTLENNKTLAIPLALADG